MRHMNDMLAGLLPSAEPTSPDVGTIWIDARTDEVLVWDGTYWRVGELIRVETVLAVGAAPVANVDLGWNVPANYAVVKAALRLLKTLTGAGGCVLVGLGIGGNTGKYSDTASLAAGQTCQIVNPTWNDGTGEDIKVYAESAINTPNGTIEGSVADDIRVIVWMRQPVVLPS